MAEINFKELTLNKNPSKRNLKMPKKIYRLHITCPAKHTTYEDYKTIGKLYAKDILNYHSNHLFFNGLKIKISQKRLTIFRKSLYCVKCGLKGNFFLIQKSGNWGWHVNLWHISNKLKRLITIDHKIPKAKSGNSDVSNLQTMCSKCNHDKADKIAL